jgi:hypothetical protein
VYMVGDFKVKDEKGLCIQQGKGRGMDRWE